MLPHSSCAHQLVPGQPLTFLLRLRMKVVIAFSGLIGL